MSEIETRAPRMRGSLRVVLFASLALNLLVVGLVLGAVVSHRSDERQRSPRVEQAGGLLATALTRRDRREVGREMRKSFRAGQFSRGDIRADFVAVTGALTAEPYDPAAVRATVTTLMQKVSRRSDAGMAILLRKFDEMSADERAAYARRLGEVLERRSKRPPKGLRDRGDTGF